MKLNVETKDATTVVTVHSARLDASLAPTFKTEMSAIIQAGARQIVLDLSEVKMVDSSGLGTMVSLLKSMNGQGSISVRGATPSVLGLFKLTRMDRVFNVIDSGASA
jgi:anti-sigma B factor antagonist